LFFDQFNDSPWLFINELVVMVLLSRNFYISYI